MDMRPFGFAQLGRQPTFEAKRGELRGKLDHQYRIGKAPKRFRAVNASSDEQERQSGSQPQQESENIGPPALGQRRNIFLALVRCQRGIQGCCTSRA